jgi:hypothetical protein
MTRKQDGAPRLVVRLREIGVEAELINTGSNCWSASVKLSNDYLLNANNAFDEGYAWSIYDKGEFHMSGRWPTARAKVAARRIKLMIEGFGELQC